MIVSPNTLKNSENCEDTLSLSKDEQIQMQEKDTANLRLSIIIRYFISWERQKKARKKLYVQWL